MDLHRIKLRIALAIVLILSMAIIFLGLCWLYRGIFPQTDFALFIRQNILLVWQGQNPYLGVGPYIPPWIYLLLGPLLSVPEPVGAALVTLLNLAGLAFLLYRSKTSLPVMAMALFSPVVLSLVMTSNLDGLFLVGALLPPQWGLFIVLAKPQLGLGIALYWAWEAYHSGGIHRLIRVFAPVGLAFLASFALYGVYLLHGTAIIFTGWNVNRFLFPYLVAPALLLLLAAVRRRRISLSYGVGPLASPYATPNSYIGLIPAFAWDWRWAAAIWLLEWGVFLWHFMV